MSKPYSDSEITALQGFRERISDVELDSFWGDDFNLMRWIRAGDLNLDKVEQIFRKNQNWRKSAEIPKIVNKPPPPSIVQSFPLKVLGFDEKDEDLVAIIPFGLWDIRTLVEKGEGELLTHCLNYVIEMAYRLTRTRSIERGGGVIVKLTLIVDMDEFSTWQIFHKPTVDFLMEMVQNLEDNHPEVVKALHFVNCPKTFELLWLLIRPLMTTRTLSKVNIMGTDPKVWRAQLLENVRPAQILPSSYGGANTTVPEASSYLPQIMKMNLEVDELKLILQTNHLYTRDQLGDKIVVGAGTKFETTVEVPSTGGILRWAFRTDENDVGFGLFENDDKIIVPMVKVDADKHVQLGTYKSPSGGFYKFCFDNTYSYFTAKNLYHKIEVVTTTQEEEEAD